MRAENHRAVRFLLVIALFAGLIPVRGWAAACGTVLSPLSVSATSVNFGTYDPVSGAAMEATGTVTIACDLGADVVPALTVSLSSGAATNFTPRTMTLGVSALAYNLFTAASLTSIWGDGTNDTEPRTSDGLLVLGNVEMTIYGAVPPEQFVQSGAYTDTIIITVEY